jgi:hypothetical protein
MASLLPINDWLMYDPHPLLRRIGAQVSREDVDKILSVIKFDPQDKEAQSIYWSRGSLTSQLEFLKATVILRDRCSTIKQRERFNRAVEDESSPLWTLARFAAPDPEKLLASVMSEAERLSDKTPEHAWWTNERVVQCLVRLYSTLFAREPSSDERSECCLFVAACMRVVVGKDYSPATVARVMTDLAPEEKYGPIVGENRS